MSEPEPKTLAEWIAYIKTLTGEDLREKAIAANSVAFVQILQEEGYKAAEIHAIMIHLARRFTETGQRAPGGGLYDLDELAKTAPPATET